MLGQGNIPIDATIALEFLPQSKRYFVFLLSLWQPVGVVIASVIAFGTAAKWRCDPDLPSCKAVAAGEACCTVKSNMGWRYEVIILGLMTLAIFFLRVVVFRFHESPKFLLSRGREAEAIEVLHKIAKYNKASPPTLTLEHFAAIDEEASQNGIVVEAPNANAKNVVANVFGKLKHLKGLFKNKLATLIFVLLAIAYMVSSSVNRRNSANLVRATTGHLTWQVLIYQSSFSSSTSPLAQAPLQKHTDNMCISTFQES